jgi:phosphatidylglycerophosphate synthase
MIVSCFVSMCYDTTLMEDIPQWTFLLYAISIFVYQTLDAIDGKQARRTKSSSPLGQLFDHGICSYSNK